MSAIRYIASLDTDSLPFHISSSATLLSAFDVTLRSLAAWAFSTALVKLSANEEYFPALRTREGGVVPLPIFVFGEIARVKVATSQICYLRAFSR